jgi:DNA-binding response OmpR family regulator
VHKILIIEDERDTAKVLLKRLSSEGFNVIVAQDGYQGVQFAHKEKPNLIILDLMLPAGGGFSVLKNIRLSSRGQTIPVVVLTAIKDEEYKQKVLDEGVDAYLEKPYDPDIFITTIKNILKKKG